ncbi:small ubiquitin-like modifier 2, partial [Prunus dulcis]
MHWVLFWDETFSGLYDFLHFSPDHDSTNETVTRVQSLLRCGTQKAVGGSAVVRDRERQSQKTKMSTPQQEEDKKPNDQAAHINLKVKGQDGNEVFFRIKRSTQLKKLMNAYCDRQSVELNSIAFLFDGRRLRAEQTPDELEMEDGDEIDAMLHQTGGAEAVVMMKTTVFYGSR